jgi:SAM-dependent methyltransferase
MREHEQTLYVGAPRGAALTKTVDVITGKLRRLSRLSGDRLLDVGCGDGTFTRVLGARFREICGIDVQDTYLEQFRIAVKTDARFAIANMSASEMRFPDDHFDTVIAIETLEHIPNLNGAASEICRVLRPGGELLITVPNRWFPFENHGARIRRWHWGGRVPLLTYWPWLHRRTAVARVFRIRDLDSLFAMRGLQRMAVDYAWPTFEHGGNPFQPFLKPLFRLMRKGEESPLRMFGSSVIVRYVKP